MANKRAAIAESGRLVGADSAAFGLEIRFAPDSKEAGMKTLHLKIDSLQWLDQFEAVVAECRAKMELRVLGK